MNDSDDNADPAGSCAACALVVWLAVQLAALAVGAAGIRLSDNWPNPPTSLALHDMLATQVFCASMIFPWLFRDWRAAVMAIAATWPMTMLAGITAERPLETIVSGGTLVGIWLASLAVWSHIFRSNRSQLIGASLAKMLCAGDAFMFYLARDFGTTWAGWGPLCAALRQADHAGLSSFDWATPLSSLLVAIFVAKALRRSA